MVGNASLCRTIDVSRKRVSRGSARQQTCCSSDPGVSTYLSLTRRNAQLTAPPECDAPVRTYIPELLDDVLEGRIEQGQVFDFETDLDEIGEAYAAMDERRAIKSLVRVGSV